MKILNRFNGSIIFKFECNTIKECVEEAIKNRANLSGADLSRADLSRADLSEANLSGADLSRADLSRADLNRANLRGANLSGASFLGEELTKNPLYINAGLNWQIWISDTKIKIGCQTHTTIAWSNFTDEQISKMDNNALDFWKKWKEPILLLAKTHQGK